MFIVISLPNTTNCIQPTFFYGFQPYINGPTFKGAYYFSQSNSFDLFINRNNQMDMVWHYYACINTDIREIFRYFFQFIFNYHGQVVIFVKITPVLQSTNSHEKLIRQTIIKFLKSNRVSLIFKHK